jgi:hypothetical protein
MPAILLLKRRYSLNDQSFVDLVVWELATPVAGSAHRFKYRLAAVVDERCVLRYDNEAGKGDHKHIGDREIPYRFTDLEGLMADFWADVSQLTRGGNEHIDH